MAGKATSDDKPADQKPDAAPPENDEATEASPAPEPKKAKRLGQSLKRLMTVKALVILVVISLIAQGIGFAWSRLHSHRDNLGEPGTEIALGSYHFAADPSERSGIEAADFSLHIALIEELDPQSRRVLTQRQNRVKQDVEELLRQAHGGDFEDPLLGELKRRLQERINQTLGLRAISDVIITDLEVHHKQRPATPAVETVNSVPWVEKPSS